MSFNFLKILSESFNFLLNKKGLALFFIVAFTIVALAFQYLSLNFLPADAELVLTDMNSATQSIILTIAAITIAAQLVSSLLTVWFLSNISLASQQQKSDLGASFVFALRHFIGFLLVSIIMVFPLSLAIGALTAGNAGIIGILSLLVSLYIFIRLCLVPYAYILEDNGLWNAIKLVWSSSLKKFLLLFIYALISYLLPMILSNYLGKITTSSSVLIVTTIINAVISTYIVVFNYRFYSVYRQNI